MKNKTTITLAVISVSALTVLGGTQERVIPTTSQYWRNILTNEDQGSSAAALGSLSTNRTLGLKPGSVVITDTNNLLESATNGPGFLDGDGLGDFWFDQPILTGQIVKGSNSTATAIAPGAIGSTNLAAQSITYPSLNPSLWAPAGTNIAVAKPFNTRLRYIPQFLNYTNPYGSGAFSNINILCFGDSIAAVGSGNSVLDSVFGRFVGRFGFGGNNIGNYLNTGIATMSAGSQFLPQDTNWWESYFQIPSGQTLTYTNFDQADGGFYADTAGVYYFAGPNEGTFQVKTNVNGGAYATAFTVNAFQSTGPVILFTNITGLSYNWDSSIQVATTAGTCHFIGFDLHRSANGEAILEELVQGGNNLLMLQAMNGQSLTNVLRALNPQVLLFTMKENGDYPLSTYSNTIPWFDSVVRGAVPACDIVYIAPYPDATDLNADYTTTRMAEADALQAMAWQLGRPFIQLEHFWTYQMLTNLAFFADTVHMNSIGCGIAGQYANLQLNQVLGFDEGFPVTYRAQPNNTRGVRSQVIVGTEGVYQWGKVVIADPVPGFGSGILGIGCPFNNAIALDGTGSTTPQGNTPGLILSTTNTYLQSPNANGEIFFFNRNNPNLTSVSGLLGGFNTNGGILVGASTVDLDQTTPYGWLRTLNGAIITDKGIASNSISNNVGYASSSTGATNTSKVCEVFQVTASSATIVFYNNAGKSWCTNTTVTGVFPIVLQPGGFWTNSGTITINGETSF